MIRAVTGTRDILPAEVSAWQRVEAAARRLFARYGYREIRTPIFEETQLFARGIGADTDIVAKEMYTFEDRDGASLTLRPEATAGIVRSVIENNLMNTDPALKVYTLGPMFRRERPQKGRYRQFHQVNVEAFGFVSPAIDVEIVEMALAYLDACGVTGYELVLNSVGDPACRPAYVETLRKALRASLHKLGADSQRRTETNPLRVLDSKAPEEQALIATRCAASSTSSEFVIGSITGWCAASTTTRAPPSRSRAGPSEPRTACSAAAGTTGSSRSWAARTSRASASPSAWSAWSWLCRPRRRSPAATCS